MPGTSTAPKLATRPGTEVIPGVRVFAPAAYEFLNPDGSARVETFSADDLRQLHDNFHRLWPGDEHGTQLRPLVTVSHRPADQFAEDDPRCHGVVGPDLHFRGDELFASLVDVPAATVGMVRRGELRNGSPEIRRRFRDRGRDYGHVLMRFALLGKDQPRVKRGELPYQFADAGPAMTVARGESPSGRAFFLPLPESESVLCFSEALTVTTAAEPTPAPAATPAPTPEPKPASSMPAALDPAALAKLQELLAFADELPAIRQNLTAAKADAEAARKLEGDRLDREKRDKVKRFLDSPGLCFADDSGRVRVLPCQRSFFEDALLREDAGAVLTFADGDKQIQGTALDRKMAEIRKFPPQLDFSEKMRQPTPDQEGGAVPSPADRDRILSLTPMGKGILQRERERAALALPAAK